MRSVDDDLSDLVHCLGNHQGVWTGRYLHQVQKILGNPRGRQTLSELQILGSTFSAKGRKWWAWFFATSVITGISAASVLVIYFAVELVKTLITVFCVA